MNTSPPPKRIKLDLSPSASQANDQHPEPGPGVKEIELSEDPGDDELQQEEHCTICLQPFLDKTIISVCAHEFCFECILLWSEQSRKCPLCARSFGNAYLIHHIRSQYDYQKHYLPPLRSSSPPLTGESQANALRHARRERQWGRRQRQRQEGEDQLERAIARRRWLYQHHLYAKHIASNAYTRYRPFPTPAQFAASPDLVSRMTIFLRRELRVWPNLDVEFLTTYTISLMKSIDIRSEPAVKLLSEFLDLDSPYTPGARHINAEHFVHEIYNYLRSPYRDLNMYDQTAQYDTPPAISPPQEIERGSRWSADPSSFRRRRSRSRARDISPIPHRDNTERHGQERSAEAHRVDRLSRRHSHRRSPGNVPLGQEDPSYGSRSPLSSAQDILDNDHPQFREMAVPAPSSSSAAFETQSTGSSFQHHVPGNPNGKGAMTECMNQIVPVTGAPQKMNVPPGDDVAAVSEASMTGVMNGPLTGIGDDVVNYVDNDLGGSSANAMLSRKCSAGLGVHPRQRTLSAGVQAHLGRLSVSGHPIKQRGNGRTGGGEGAGVRRTFAIDGGPTLLSRLTDGPTVSDVFKKDSTRDDASHLTNSPAVAEC